jgi:hypothetical protein
MALDQDEEKWLLHKENPHPEQATALRDAAYGGSSG